MVLMTRTACLLALALGLCLGAGAVRCETVTPGKVVYRADVRENTQAKLCLLTVAVRHPTEPESVIAAAVAGWDKLEKVVIVAINIGVFDFDTSQAKLAVHFVPLANAGFSSATFDSAGLLQNKGVDNSVWIWMPRDNALPFLNAFTAGDFRLIFSRAAPPRIRSYRISQAPPDAVRQSFVTCADRLVPKVSPAPPATSMRGNKVFVALRRMERTYGAPLARIVNGPAKRIMGLARATAR